MSNYDAALKRATEVLGDRTKAKDWLDSMSATLGGKPKDIIEQPNGLDTVLKHLHGIEMNLSTDA